MTCPHSGKYFSAQEVSWWVWKTWTLSSDQSLSHQVILSFSQPQFHLLKQQMKWLLGFLPPLTSLWLLFYSILRPMLSELSSFTYHPSLLCSILPISSCLSSVKVRFVPDKYWEFTIYLGTAVGIFRLFFHLTSQLLHWVDNYFSSFYRWEIEA